VQRRCLGLFIMGLALALAGCRSSNDTSTTKPADDVVTGKVVSQPPPPGHAGIETWRFQPDNCPTHYLRLTTAKMQEAVSPEAKEIKLDPWAGKKIKVKYQAVDEKWVWGAEVAN
jgi:hypothetical protein